MSCDCPPGLSAEACPCDFPGAGHPDDPRLCPCSCHGLAPIRDPDGHLLDAGDLSKRAPLERMVVTVRLPKEEVNGWRSDPALHKQVLLDPGDLTKKIPAADVERMVDKVADDMTAEWLADPALHEQVHESMETEYTVMWEVHHRIWVEWADTCTSECDSMDEAVEEARRVRAMADRLDGLAEIDAGDTTVPTIEGIRIRVRRDQYITAFGEEPTEEDKRAARRNQEVVDVLRADGED